MILEYTYNEIFLRHYYIFRSVFPVTENKSSSEQCCVVVCVTSNCKMLSGTVVRRIGYRLQINVKWMNRRRLWNTR